MSKKIGNLKGEPGKQADTPVIPWPRGGGSGVIVQDEGSNLNAGKIVSAVDFEGAGVTAAMSGTKAVVTIPGSQGGGGVTVTIVAADPGAIGAGNLWLNPDVSGGFYGSPLPQLFMRNETDTGWYVVTAPIDAATTGRSYTFSSATDKAEVIVNDDTIRLLNILTLTRIQVSDSGLEIRDHLGNEGTTAQFLGSDTATAVARWRDLPQAAAVADIAVPVTQADLTINALLAALRASGLLAP